MSTPEFSKAFFATAVPSSIGDTDFSDPPKLPIAVLDPDERVNGQGISILEAAGIEVQVGVLEEQASLDHSGYFFTHNII